MAFEKKIAANRLNAKRSTGPRTSRGKSRASGNAWRHGWAVAKSRHSTVSADVEVMAKAICGEYATPALFEQAVIIAECEIVLLNLRAARVAAIKRHSIVGQKLERSNQLSCFSANELTLAFDALAGGKLRPMIRLIKRQTRALRVVAARVANGKIGAKESDRSGREESLPPQATNLVGSAKGSDEGREPGQVRDEVIALQGALPELVSLERYERRAMSRRKQAIRMFEAISTLASFSLGYRGASQDRKRHCIARAFTGRRAHPSHKLTA
jgi:hypothetical protein